MIYHRADNVLEFDEPDSDHLVLPVWGDVCAVSNGTSKYEKGPQPR